MKKFIIITIVALFAITVTQAQNGAVPFSYDKTMEWAKIDAADQKNLLAYANTGKYDSPSTIEADSIVQTTLVKGLKSRSGKTEDQIWVKTKVNGAVKNYLFSMSDLPKIAGQCCKLTITAKRGDSDAY